MYKTTKVKFVQDRERAEYLYEINPKMIGDTLLVAL